MKRLNNKILLIILVVLLGGFVLSRLFRSPARERSLPQALLTLDTATVTEMRVHPAADKGREIKLVKQQGGWQAQQGPRTASAETALVKNALGSLEALKPERMMARKKEKWHEYNVDSTGTRVQVFAGSAAIGDLWIGKSASGSLYVRLHGEDDVYAVRGMLGNYFNKGFNEWRDKSFARIEPDSITTIAFGYPADSSFVAIKKDTAWTISGSAANATRVDRYLGRLRSKTLSTFADEFSPTANPDVEITFENRGTPVLMINGWKKDDGQWILESSQREGIYFSADSTAANDFLAARSEFQ